MSFFSVAQVLKDFESGMSNPIYLDQLLVRRTFLKKIDNNITVHGTIDYFDKYGIFNLSLSIEKPQSQDLKVLLDFPYVLLAKGDKKVLSHDQGFLVWIPDEYKEIVYSSQHRIQSIKDCTLLLRKEEKYFSIYLPEHAGNIVELSLFVFTRNTEIFWDEITQLSEIEKRSVSRGGWFLYTSIKDIWKYLIKGKFYNRSGKRIFESQLIPYAFYYYYIFLNTQTRKEVYLFLRDYVAYLTLLTLPKNNVWTQGIWMDDDIHFAHLIAGVHLFLHQYEITGQRIFLEKSSLILKYCISVSDCCMQKSRWFLHDSFEFPGPHKETRYQNVIYSLAFGKSKENTLALNTHLSTLVALNRCYRLTSEEHFLYAYQQGLKLLYHVLDAKPAGLLYSVSYGIRDLLLKILVYKKKSYWPSLLRIYDSILVGQILPALKAKYPRLCMPNGFIERDLTFSFLNQFYHLINTEQLLMLYQQEPSEQLERTITHSVRYSIKSKMCVYYAYMSELSHTLLGVLLQYGTCINPDYLKYLAEYAIVLHQKGYKLPVKVIASPYISDIHSTIKISNPNVIPLIGETKLNTIGIILNMSSEQQEFCLTSSSGMQYCLQDWNGRHYCNMDNVILGSFSSLKIMEKR